MTSTLFDDPAPTVPPVEQPPPRASLRASTFKPDPQQNAVVRHTQGPAQIDAGAGSGKSTTMASRVRSLLFEHGVPPSEILMCTFTRKGADSIVEKLQQLCGDYAAKVTVGTFHKVAMVEMLSQMPPDQRWHVLDDGDSDDIWDQSCKDTAAEMLPSAFGCELFSGNKHPNKELEKRIKNLFGALREIRSFQVNMDRASDPFGPFAAERLRDRSASYRQICKHDSRPNLIPFFDEVLARYERLKKVHNGRDYDDLLLAWRDLLRTDSDYRAATQARWRYIIVDEYQDTNYLQESVLQLLNTSNLMVVGDVAQCVYSWRSAVPRLMMEFEQRYQATRYPLEFNYRSRPEIIDVANGVLRLHQSLLRRSAPSDHKPDGPLLQLRPTRSSGGAVTFLPARTRDDETNLITSAIDDLLRQGTLPRDIVVLTRVSYYTNSLEARLRAMRWNGQPLPVQVWGGRSLLDSPTAKDILSLMKVLARPADPWPFLRLCILHPGVGEAAAHQAFFRWMFRLSPPIALQSLAGILDDLNATLCRKDRPPATRLRQMVSQACEFLRRLYASDTKLDQAERRTRENHLEALEAGMTGAIEDMAMRARETDQSIGLIDLINTFSLDPARDSVSEDALTISTVHQAKGLEWKHVFVVGVNEGTLPVLRKHDHDAELTPAQIAQVQADIEEECRILYVALTRAKDHLTVSYSLRDGVSRFLSTVPDLKARCAAAEQAMFGDSPDSQGGW